ncbi:hypothetical protein WIS52_28570 [Pseudonocardia nematodicida]|uniref:Modulator of FtsH protease n=1 Tax=Pseudonocardia nematodicida TaxID=1206997 RepID=A0ABV1KJA1_9PSEU
MLEPWRDFGVAVTGASAALVGLLYVAISINLRQIVGTSVLPARALLALVLLVVPLVSTILLLVPQPPVALGVELLVVACTAGPCLAHLVRPSARPAQQTVAERAAGTVLPAGLTVAGTLVAGVLLLAGYPAGVYGVVVAALAAFTGALAGTWVLLIEILR